MPSLIRGGTADLALADGRMPRPSALAQAVGAAAFDPLSLSPIAYYVAKGVATYAASKVNLANAGTYDLTEGNGAVTWDASSGWAFGGTKWLLTGINLPSVSTVIARFSDDSANSSCGYLVASAGSLLYILNPANPNDPTVARYYNGDGVDVAPNFTSGTIGIADRTGYRNGVSNATIPAASGTTSNLIIGALNAGGTSPYAGKCQAVFIKDAVLTEQQILQVHTALMAL